MRAHMHTQTPYNALYMQMWALYAHIDRMFFWQQHFPFRREAISTNNFVRLVCICISRMHDITVSSMRVNRSLEHMHPCFQSKPTISWLAPSILYFLLTHFFVKRDLSYLKTYKHIYRVCRHYYVKNKQKMSSLYVTQSWTGGVCT